MFSYQENAPHQHKITMTTSYNVILKAVDRIYLIMFTIIFIILLGCTIGVGYLVFYGDSTIAEKIVLGGLVLCMCVNIWLYCYGRRAVRELGLARSSAEPLLPL